MLSFSPREIETKILHFARFSPELLPSCMVSRQFRCEGCGLGDQGSCILLQEKEFLSLLRWKISNLSRLIENDVTDDLVVALVEVFESQGSALHMDKVLGLLLRQKPHLEVSLSQLKSALKGNPAFFKETDANVFVLSPDATEEHEAQTE
jgi:hypothetical protein